MASYDLSPRASAVKPSHAPPRFPHNPGANSRMASVLALQGLVGNRAVAGAVQTGQLQRQSHTHAGPPAGVTPTAAPAPAPARPDPVQVLAKRQASTDQDLRWRATFGAHLSSWRQVIFRVSGGIEAAQAGFRQARQDQATFDALVSQLAFAAATIGVAGAFEPLVGGLLSAGKVGPALKSAVDTVEAWENPVVSAVGASSNVVPAARSVMAAGASGSELPSAMAYLTQNGEALEAQNQRLEQAFATRVGERESATDERMMAFDAAAQERRYATADAALTAASAGIERMKPLGEVARVLECALWARWLATHAEQVPHMGPGDNDYVETTEP